MQVQLIIENRGAEGENECRVVFCVSQKWRDSEAETNEESQTSRRLPEASRESSRGIVSCLTVAEFRSRRLE